MNFDEFWMLGLGPKRILISHHFLNHPRSSQWQLRAAESTLLAPRLVTARHGASRWDVVYDVGLRGRNAVGHNLEIWKASSPRIEDHLTLFKYILNI